MYKEYMAMTLYAVSNSFKMTKTLEDIRNYSMPQKEVDAKATADIVAQQMGTKINWGK